MKWFIRRGWVNKHKHRQEHSCVNKSWWIFWRNIEKCHQTFVRHSSSPLSSKCRDPFGAVRFKSLVLSRHQNGVLVLRVQYLHLLLFAPIPQISDWMVVWYANDKKINKNKLDVLLQELNNKLHCSSDLKAATRKQSRSVSEDEREARRGR